jgi:predicted methyltransferase
MTHRLACCGVLLAAAALIDPVSGHSAPALPDYLVRAIDDPGRPPEQRARDAVRQPAAVVSFAGVRPGDRVADFMSGGAYFTRIFSRVVGEHGHVYAFLPDEELKNCPADEVAGTRAVEHDARYANVSVLSGPVATFATPEALDLVWTSQNFHDLYDPFMGPANVPQVLHRLFMALKPGGTLLIIDHAALAGSGVRDTDTLHRIDPAVIVRSVEAAGFQLEASSDVLSNPRDTHELRVFDAPIRGHTDQVVLRFRKPAATPPAGS